MKTLFAMHAPHKRLLCALVLVLVASTSSCPKDDPKDDRKGGQPAPLASQAQATILARLPDGWEMGQVAFGPRGEDVVFAATRDRHTRVYYNHKMIGEYPGARDLQINSALGYVFVATQGDRQQLIAPAFASTPEASIGDFFVGADGTLVYELVRDGQVLLVSGEHEVRDLGSIVGLSSDKKSIYYIANSRPNGGVQLTGCSLDLRHCWHSPTYESLNACTPDATHARVACLARQGGHVSVVSAQLTGISLRMEQGPIFDSIPIIGLSRGGARLAYVAKRGKQLVLMRDGQERASPSLDSWFALRVSPQGRVLLTGMQAGQVLALVDSKIVSQGYASIDWPSWSDDGQHYLFVVEKEGKNRLVIDGIEGASYDRIVTPRFLPDGQHVLFRAREAGRRFVVTMNLLQQNLHERPPYDAVWDPVISADHRRITYGVLSGRELRWIEEPVESPHMRQRLAPSAQVSDRKRASQAE